MRELFQILLISIFFTSALSAQDRANLEKEIDKIIFYNTEIEGFCEPNSCLGNGVLNISSCYNGVSGFISMPHFLFAEEKFRDDLVGMNPDRDKHEFILHFEPVTNNYLLFILGLNN